MNMIKEAFSMLKITFTLRLVFMNGLNKYVNTFLIPVLFSTYLNRSFLNSVTSHVGFGHKKRTTYA